MKRLFGVLCLMALALWASPASATPITAACPVFTGGGAGGVTVSAAYTANSGGVNGGCNVLITFNADGSITTSRPNLATSYDSGVDDNMVGIVNLTSSPIFSVTLTSTSDPFGFDGDGSCDPTWFFNGGSGLAGFCANAAGGAIGGYGHNGVTFSGISANFSTGTVNFAGGIAPQTGNWFTLEGPVDLNLRVVAAPEPASLLLLGTGVLALARRRRKT